MNKILLFLASIFLLHSCTDDDTPMPSYRQDMADFQTDLSGRAVSMKLDDGATLKISNEVNKLKPDTLVRVKALYTREENTAWITDYLPVLSPHVQKYHEVNVKTDPLNFVSAWKGQDYINLKLQVKGSETGTHYFGFHETECTENADGSQTLGVLLLHDQNKDPLYFTRETMLSLPLRPLAHRLTAGHDSIRLTIKTFKKTEIKTFVF